MNAKLFQNVSIVNLLGNQRGFLARFKALYGGGAYYFRRIDDLGKEQDKVMIVNCHVRLNNLTTLYPSFFQLQIWSFYFVICCAILYFVLVQCIINESCIFNHLEAILYSKHFCKVF